MPCARCKDEKPNKKDFYETYATPQNTTIYCCAECEKKYIETSGIVNNKFIKILDIIAFAVFGVSIVIAQVVGFAISLNLKISISLSIAILMMLLQPINLIYVLLLRKEIAYKMAKFTEA